MKRKLAMLLAVSGLALGATAVTQAAVTAATGGTNVTRQNISVSVVNDTTNQDDETLEVTLSNPSNAALGAITIHSLTIQDNNSPTTSRSVLPVRMAPNLRGCRETNSCSDKPTTTMNHSKIQRIEPPESMARLSAPRAFALAATTKLLAADVTFRRRLHHRHGVMPQTAANGLKPFGLLYSLVMSNQIPVAWAINPNKVTDKNPAVTIEGADFTLGTKTYRGGPFIIPAEYVNPTITNLIATWRPRVWWWTGRPRPASRLPFTRT